MSKPQLIGKCQDCIFSDEGSYPLTACHRYAPREHRKNGGGLFPQVGRGDWCGEFVNRSEATPDE